MERIKQAIERARAQRAGEPSAATSEIREQMQAGALQQNITYTKTRVVGLDKAVLARNKVLPGIDDSDVRTAYKILRTRIEQRMTASGWNALAVTSPGMSEGKTLTAINLAISLAWEMHRTVLLVDLDLRNPSVHNRLGHDVQFGIVDYLLNDKPLHEIMFNPGIDRLVVLLGCRPVQQSSELLGSPKMAQLVDELKSRYPSRFVIFDLPPLLSADDALAFSPYVDCTLLVIDDGKTKKQELASAIEILGSVNLLGTVLNNATDPQPTYY